MVFRVKDRKPVFLQNSYKLVLIRYLSSFGQLAAYIKFVCLLKRNFLFKQNIIGVIAPDLFYMMPVIGIAHCFNLRQAKVFNHQAFALGDIINIRDVKWLKRTGNKIGILVKFGQNQNWLV